jgi:hypothetical protein
VDTVDEEEEEEEEEGSWAMMQGGRAWARVGRPTTGDAIGDAIGRALHEYPWPRPS